MGALWDGAMTMRAGHKLNSSSKCHAEENFIFSPQYLNQKG